MIFSKYPYPFTSIFFSVSKCSSEKTQFFKDHKTSSVITAFWCWCGLCLFVQVLRGRKKYSRSSHARAVARKKIMTKVHNEVINSRSLSFFKKMLKIKLISKYKKRSYIISNALDLPP